MTKFYKKDDMFYYAATKNILHRITLNEHVLASFDSYENEKGYFDEVYKDAEEITREEFMAAYEAVKLEIEEKILTIK